MESLLREYLIDLLYRASRSNLPELPSIPGLGHMIVVGLISLRVKFMFVFKQSAVPESLLIRSAPIPCSSCHIVEHFISILVVVLSDSAVFICTWHVRPNVVVRLLPSEEHSLLVRVEF